MNRIWSEWYILAALLAQGTRTKQKTRQRSNFLVKTNMVIVRFQ